MQLYKFYYKNTNNLLPSYFNSFTPYYNNENHNHDLRFRFRYSDSDILFNISMYSIY